MTSSINPFLEPLNRATNLVPSLVPEGAPSFSSMGFRFFSLLGSSTGAYRSILGQPLWRNSPYYPDLPNGIGFQCLGFITALHAYLGLRNFWKALESSSEGGSCTIHKVLKCAVSLGQSGVGFAFGFLRVANIAKKIAGVRGQVAAAARWETLARRSGSMSGLASVALYVPLVLDQGLRGIRSARLFKGVKKEERLTYLQGLYRADEKRLEDAEMQNHPDMHRSAAKANIAMQAAKLAIEEQVKLWQDSIAFMKKQGVCREDFVPSSQELERFVAEVVGQENLENYGKKLLLARLQDKNVRELTYLIGKKGVDALASSSPIDLRDIDASHAATKWEYADKCFLYGVGALSVLMLCLYTAGAPFFIGSILSAAVFTREAQLSYRDIERTVEDNTPPGKFDTVWPIVSSVVCLSSLGTAFYVTLAFGLGGAPLLFTGLGAFLWLGLNYQQIGCIEKKRHTYIEFLLKKEELEPSEFAYIAGNGGADALKEALERLPERHLRGIEAYREQGERNYCKATELYTKSLQLSWLETNIEPLLRRRFEEGRQRLFREPLALN